MHLIKSISKNLMSLVTSAVILTGCFPAQKHQNKPNLVLIMADDLGYNDLSCFGSTIIQTPNIDSLAQFGVKFSDFHSNGAVCSPTRAALLTGRYQQRSGIEGVVTAKNHRHTGLDVSEVTFAEELKKSGYGTSIFGKWHVGYDTIFNPVKQGFDEFYGYVSGNIDYFSHIDQMGNYDWWHNTDSIYEPGYSTDLITRHAISFIKENKDKPFCLYVAHEAPHYPYQGRGDKADRTIGGEFPTGGSREDKKNAYKEMVEIMDEGIGKIVQTIRELGLSGKTFIFFCSDNGATRIGSNSPLHGFKGSLWEGGHRVPAIAYWPGHIEPGSRINDPVMSMDLFPTLLSLAGEDVSNDLGLDGTDFSSAFLKNKSLPERTLFWRFKQQKVARKGKWKLLIQKEGEFLFNLEEDIGEANDLSDKYPEVFNKLSEELAEWENDINSGTPLKTK